MADKKLYAIIEAIGDEYGFNVDDAMELVADQVDELLAMLVKPAKATKEEKVGVEDEIMKKTRHNIELWETKLEKGDFKDREAHVLKIEKEKKKLEKLLKNSAPPPQAAAEKKVDPPKKKEEPPAKQREKRIKKVSPLIAGQLSKILEEEGLEFNEALKKKFANVFIEDLSEEEYKEKGLADHMRIFAKVEKTLSSNSFPPPKKEEECLRAVQIQQYRDAVKRGMTLGGGGGPEPCTCGKCPSDKKETREPETSEDEEQLEVEFNGKDYFVGRRSGTIWEEQDGRDVAVGFAGVGKFKKLVLP